MAGAPSQTDIVTNPMASAQMALNYGPQTQQALRRSQYLADALRQMMTEGSQNIRSGGELGAKLLATAILQRGNNKSQDALIQAMTGDRQATDKLLTADTPLASGYQPQSAPAPAAAPPVPPPAADAAAPPPQAAAPAAPTGPALSDSDKLNLARAVWGEARGEPSAGQQAVASVILNRARESGKPVGDIIAQPHQFAGFNPQSQGLTPDQLGPIMANIGPVLNGTAPDPTNGADHFFNPALAHPSWGQGDGQMIGQHKFMNLGYGGQPPAQGTPNMPPPIPPDPNGPPAQNGPSPQNVPPFQVASNGPVPMPGGAPGAGPQPPMPNAPGPQGGAPPMPQPQGPQGAPNMPPPGAMPQAPPQAGPMPPQGPPAGPGPQAQPAGIPTQVVTQQEWHNAAALLGNWRTHDLGVQELLKLKARAAAPVEDPSKPYWGDDGRAHYAPGTENKVTRGTLPGSYWVESPQHDLRSVSEANLNNAPPAGYDRDPNNANHLILQGTGAGPSAPAGGPQGAAAPQGQGIPPGKAPIPPALQKPFMDQLEAYHKAPGYTDYVNSVNAANALEANLKASLGNNTIVDQTAVDSTIRAMTGLSARQGSVNAVLEHLPWSEQLKGFISHAVGPDGMNGYITPKVLQQMRTAVHAYADGHRQLAEQEYGQYNSGANRMGFDLGQELPGVAPQAAINWMDGDGAGNPAAPQAASVPNYAAEIARRKANGTWKGR